MARRRFGLIALIGLSAVVFASGSSADPVSFAATEVGYCYLAGGTCPAVADDFSTVAGTPATSSFSQAFTFTGVHSGFNVGVTSSVMADQGFFSAYAASEGFVSVAGGDGSIGIGNSTYAFGQDLDYLTVSAGAFMVLPIHLTGSVDISYSEGGGHVFDPSTVFAHVSLNFACFAGPTNCSQNFDFTASATVDTILNLVIPFIPGDQFSIQTSETLIASFGLPFFPPETGDALLTGHAIGDFSHTGVFGPATVYDSVGNPLSDVVIDSVSGFDYRAGYSTTAASVPEPATLVLLGFGLAGLGIMRRRRVA